MPSGKQISLQPALTLVFAKLCVQYAPFGGKEFIVFGFLCVPLPIGSLKNGTQKIRKCFIRTKNTEIIRVEFNNIPQKVT